MFDEHSNSAHVQVIAVRSIPQNPSRCVRLRPVVNSREGFFSQRAVILGEQSRPQSTARSMTEDPSNPKEPTPHYYVRTIVPAVAIRPRLRTVRSTKLKCWQRIRKVS